MPQWRYRIYPTRYLANMNPSSYKEFHDLENEDKTPNAFQIEEIIKHKHVM